MARIDAIPGTWKSANWLELSPIGANYTVDAAKYILRVQDNDELFEYSFSVENWQTKHDEIWIISRAFAEASSLVRDCLDIDIWRNGLKHPASFSSNPTPLHLTMSGNNNLSTITFRLYVEQPETKLFRYFGMRVSLESAERFGNVLELEIAQAAPVWAKSNKAVNARGLTNENI